MQGVGYAISDGDVPAALLEGVSLSSEEAAERADRISAQRFFAKAVRESNAGD